ncbi:MAG TPA: PAS domain S-box protein, partial [Bacillota bacterium]|nr:PAS domain S-box protein [Bacillota bacterium]
MTLELIRNLIMNAALLLAMSILFNMFFMQHFENEKAYNLRIGIIVGIIGMFLMINTVTLPSNVIFDTRSILVSITGLFMGVIPTGIAVLIISIYRILIGGVGAFTGVMKTAVTAGIGLLWRHFRWKQIISNKKQVGFEFYTFGMVTHLAMLACMFTLPNSLNFVVLKDISLPILVIYPLATVLICFSITRGLATRQTEINLKESDLRFRTMFEQAPMGIAFANVQGLFRVNKMFEKILKRSEEEIITLRWESYTYPDDLPSDLAQFQALLSGTINDYSMNKRFIRPDGSLVWVHMTIVALNTDQHSEKNYVCMIHDITEMVKAEGSLQESRTNYKNLYLEFEQKQNLLISLLNSIPDLIFYKDMEGRYLGCNNAFAKFAGMPESKIIGLTDYDLFDPIVAGLFRGKDIAMLKQKSQIKQEELVTYPDGSKVYLDTLKTLFFASDGNLVGLIGVSRDISERKQKEEEILYLSYHDVLTALYNRTFFDLELKRLDTKSQLPLSVIIGDIDGLKLINDAFGHAEGDRLLMEIAKILRNCCRQEDIIARTGGDEFSILLPKTEYDMTKIIYDQIKKTCEEYATKSEHKV